MIRHIHLLLPAALLAVLVSACGGSSSETTSTAAPADAGHIHGLGINPADGALFIATHGGLFRSADGETSVARVGTGTQDTMGFTIVGPDQFLGSGHPGVGESGPPLLGLIRSDDAGGGWRPVSLAGAADFHILRSSAGRVYGFNSSNGRLMSSGDEGQTWAELEPPAPLLDLAIDPEDPDHVVASGEGGLYESSDGGESWRSVGDQIGYLAWPTREALYLVDGKGTVQMSDGVGGQWQRRGSIGGQPVAFLATSEDQVYGALGDGTVVASSDSGRSWSLRAAP